MWTECVGVPELTSKNEVRDEILVESGRLADFPAMPLDRSLHLAASPAYLFTVHIEHDSSKGLWSRGCFGGRVRIDVAVRVQFIVRVEQESLGCGRHWLVSRLGKKESLNLCQ